ncbi:hypothetical protein F66182_413 [Fusarium sp. NRRL 66182]|nr:hypothetical protein F66182_413 [Fusarium sp. NRRL 66182]
MDPLSIASGVAGLLTVSAAVIKILDTAKLDMKNAPRTIFWAHAEVQDINVAIKRLKTLIDTPDLVPKSARMSVGFHDATVTIRELIASCDRLVGALDPLDRFQTSSVTKWDAVRWLRVQDDVVKYVRQLQSHKLSITLILNILQCESDIVVVESQRELDKKIEAVLSGNELTQKRLGDLENMLNKFMSENATLIPSSRSSMVPSLNRWREEGQDNTTDASSTVASQTGYDNDVSHAFYSERASSFPRMSVPNISQTPQPPKLKRSTSTESSATAGKTPLGHGGFEAALQETGVYRRVHNSSDAFSICSTGRQSMAGSIMTSFSLDRASVLQVVPIMMRSELQHPGYYAHMSSNQRLSRDLMRALTTRSVAKSPVEPPPTAPFSLKQFRSPPNCGESVMGRWSQSRTKEWRPKEFRTEVTFEVPVIFVSTSGNMNIPIPGEPVYYIDGTRKSLDDTKTDLEPPPSNTMSKSGRVIRNERATWLALLSSLQRMENESRNWTRQQIMALRPRPASATAILTSISGKHSLSVAIQRDKKSWDDMPPSINRPYATTTMSQLVEVLAMLGIYWRDFNSTHHVYQAEGNGFLVKGNKISGLGIMFHFQALEKAVFGANRPIPTRAVTRLAFGQLPTIFSQQDFEGQENEQLHEAPFVRLGSPTDIADTLASFGCHRKSTNYFLRDGATTSHMFPITFELIGMIGQILHIKHLCFRYIPNPCCCVWSPRGFSLPKLLISYRSYFLESDIRNAQLLAHVDTLVSAKAGIQTHDGAPQEYGWQAQNALHQAIDELDATLKADHSRSHLAQTILGCHFQETLLLMNDQSSTFPHFNHLQASTREDRLIKAYFQQVLPAVLRSVSSAFFSIKTSDSEFHVVKDKGAQTVEYAEYLLAAKDIWCTLVLRMICWLMLHDFHRHDVQITKGELFGSDLPVYIS